LLDAFQDNGLLSGTEMIGESVVNGEGRYQRARLMQALTRIESPLRDKVIAVLDLQSDYVFLNERGQPFGRMGVGRMIERAGEAAKLPFPVHVHMLRHSTGYALAGRGMDTRRLQHFLGHASITNTVRYTAMSPEPFKDIWR
jgi:site-specific recombinase XerD